MRHYKINEMFYSLQGEGFFTGKPAFFIRFSGCNLDCPFCDTLHETGEMLTVDEILRRAAACPAQHVVLTGGEPALFVDAEIIDGLHAIGKFIAIETNGTHALPDDIDWVTLSPKSAFLPQAPAIVLRACDELKIVYDGTRPCTYEDIKAKHRFIQPCDTGNAERNADILAATIRWCLAHPTWRLSLQTHKLAGIH